MFGCIVYLVLRYVCLGNYRRNRSISKQTRQCCIARDIPILSPNWHQLRLHAQKRILHRKNIDKKRVRTFPTFDMSNKVPSLGFIRADYRYNIATKDRFRFSTTYRRVAAIFDYQALPMCMTGRTRPRPRQTPPLSLENEISEIMGFVRIF